MKAKERLDEVRQFLERLIKSYKKRGNCKTQSKAMEIYTPNMIRVALVRKIKELSESSDV